MAEAARGTADIAAFERVVMPHLDSAHNLAMWLVRNRQDAEDVVQEAYLRALRFFGGYQGGDARAWILRIVRNTSYTFLERNRAAEKPLEFDEEIHTAEGAQENAETALVQSVDAAALRGALEELPARFREVLVLREIEGLSYKEIADVMGVPIGTVMSGLARGRAQLKQLVLKRREEEQRGLPR